MPSMTINDNKKNVTLFDDEIRYKGHIIHVTGRVFRKVEPERRVVSATIFEKGEKHSLTSVEKRDRLNKNITDVLKEIFTSYKFKVPDTEDRLEEVLDEAKEIVDTSENIDEKYNVQKEVGEYWDR